MSTQPSSSDVPRDPSAFRPTPHFTERFHDRYEDELPPRHLDGDIVSGCIQEGSIDAQPGGKVAFRETFGGVTYLLVVDPTDREVVTGYPIAINTDVASASDRWSSREVDDIHEFIRHDPR